MFSNCFICWTSFFLNNVNSLNYFHEANRLIIRSPVVHGRIGPTPPVPLSLTNVIIPDVANDPIVNEAVGSLYRV